MMKKTAGRNGGNYYPCCLLRGLAEHLGYFPLAKEVYGEDGSTEKKVEERR